MVRVLWICLAGGLGTGARYDTTLVVKIGGSAPAFLGWTAAATVVAK